MTGSPVPGAPGAGTPTLPAVLLRRMRWWDLHAVLPAEQVLFPDDPWSAGMFLSELADRRGRWYVVAAARADPRGVLGWAGLHCYADEAYLNTIGVLPAAQRRGVGGRLLDAVVAEARSRGAAFVGLEVAAGNAVAQRLYGSRGFEPVGLRRRYYRATGEDAVVMVLTLGGGS